MLVSFHVFFQFQDWAIPMPSAQVNAPLSCFSSARAIAPKKSKARESQMVQKQLQKAINSNIEEEMKKRASKDATSFKVWEVSSNMFIACLSKFLIFSWKN